MLSYISTRRFVVQSIFTLSVLLLIFQPDAKAQVKPKKYHIPPKIMDSPAEARKKMLNANPVLKILDEALQELPLAFAWQLNADTLLNANDVFREIIEFEGGAILRKSMASDTVSLKKSTEPDYDVRRSFLSFSGDMTSYEVSQQKGKSILVLENTETHDKQYFKVFLDKPGKKILKIQNITTGRFYLPVPFEGGSVMF